MISRISLGTAQFGQEYGIANARGKVSKNEVVEIFDYARRVGINCIDTAFVYGVSESVIGGYLRENPSNFKIVSKLPPLEQYRPGKVAELLGQSLEHLGIKQLYGYLLHRFNDILVNGKIWDDLAHIKKSGKVEKIGFSLYSPEELVLLLDKEIEFDIVQVPYSIFDRRFEKQFSLLKEKKVEIHVRSVFLQGLAFLSPEQLPQPLQRAKDTLMALRDIAERKQISINALCLNFVLLNPLIDQAVIGVDSLQHLKKNVEDVNFFTRVEDLKDILETFVIKDEDVILPYRWSRT